MWTSDQNENNWNYMKLRKCAYFEINIRMGNNKIMYASIII